MSFFGNCYYTHSFYNKLRTKIDFVNVSSFQKKKKKKKKKEKNCKCIDAFLSILYILKWSNTGTFP